MAPKLIGLYSPSPQSGKSTIAQHLKATRHYVVLPFAETLKDMATVLLEALGHEREHIEQLLSHNKGFYVPELGCTVRHLLQTLGTDFGRKLIDRDIWNNVWLAKYQSLRHRNIDVVVDDVRFVNEAELLTAFGGEVWHIDRPSVNVPSTHASEGGLDDWPGFSRRLRNDSDRANLLEKVSALTGSPQLPTFVH